MWNYMDLTSESVNFIAKLHEFSFGPLVYGQDCWGPSQNESLQPLADRMRSMLLTAQGA